MRGSSRVRESEDPAQKRVLMLITHGNGGNISVRLDQYREFVDRFRYIDVFALEYRGYGLSEGSPSEEGIAMDAVAARTWIDGYVKGLSAELRPSIVYFGRSLGGSVATRLASVMAPDALILECPLLSVPYLAKTITPWRYLPIERFIHNRFDTESHMQEVRCPVLVMHSEFDEIIPIECGRMVFDAAKGPKRFYVIKGAPAQRGGLLRSGGVLRGDGGVSRRIGLISWQNELTVAFDQSVQNECHGSKTSTPSPSKSLTLRVAMVRSWTLAVPPMRTSPKSMTLPEIRALPEFAQPIPPLVCQ